MTEPAAPVKESRYGSRKWLIALLGMLIAAVLRWRGLLSDESTVTVLLGGMLGYSGTNVWQKSVEAKAKP